MIVVVVVVVVVVVIVVVVVAVVLVVVVVVVMVAVVVAVLLASIEFLVRRKGAPFAFWVRSLAIRFCLSAPPGDRAPASL